MSGAALDCRLISDPPRAGECKIRIKTDGTEANTNVYAVDCDGRELLVLGLAGVGISWGVNDTDHIARGTITILGDIEFRPIDPQGER